MAAINKQACSGYFTWLSNMAGRPSSGGSYKALLEYLHVLPFIAVMKEDEFRVINGQALRRVYGKTLTEPEQIELYFSDKKWFDVPCSMLEMMLGLAGILAIINGMKSNRASAISFWFWKLAFNLGFEAYSDESHAHGEIDTMKINSIVHILIHREYGPNGHGSLFPIQSPISTGEDLSKLEIWYQMKHYLNEYNLLAKSHQE